MWQFECEYLVNYRYDIFSCVQFNYFLKINLVFFEVYFIFYLNFWIVNRKKEDKSFCIYSYMIFSITSKL